MSGFASGAKASSCSSSLSRAPHPSASNACTASRSTSRLASGSAASARNRPIAVSKFPSRHATWTAAEPHQRAVGVLLQGGERAGGRRHVVGGELLGDEVEPGHLERRVEVERLLEVGQRAAAVGQRPPGLAAVDVRERVGRLQGDELLGRVEALAVPAGGVVPRGQLPPPGDEPRLLGDQLSHGRDGLRAVAAPGVHPRRPARAARPAAGSPSSAGLHAATASSYRPALASCSAFASCPGTNFGYALMTASTARSRSFGSASRPSGESIQNIGAHGWNGPPPCHASRSTPYARSSHPASRISASAAWIGNGDVPGPSHTSANARVAASASSTLHANWICFTATSGPAGVLLEHGQRLPGVAELVVGQVRVEQDGRGRRVGGADLQRLAQVGLAALAVAGLELRLAPHGPPGRVVRLEPDEFRCGLEVLLRAAGLVVPVGQLVPAPHVTGVHGDERVHPLDRRRVVAAPRLHPRLPPLQDDRHVVGELRRGRGLQCRVEPAHLRQPLGLQVVGLHVPRVEGDGPVERGEHLVVVPRVVQHPREPEPHPRVAGPVAGQFAGQVGRLVRGLQPLGPHLHGVPRPLVPRLEAHRGLRPVERLARPADVPQPLRQEAVRERVGRVPRGGAFEDDDRLFALVGVVERVGQFARGQRPAGRHRDRLPQRVEPALGVAESRGTPARGRATACRAAGTARPPRGRANAPRPAAPARRAAAPPPTTPATGRAARRGYAPAFRAVPRGPPGRRAPGRRGARRST